jgi:hypothetical protein
MLPMTGGMRRNVAVICIHEKMNRIRGSYCLVLIYKDTILYEVACLSERLKSVSGAFVPADQGPRGNCIPRCRSAESAAFRVILSVAGMQACPIPAARL